MELKYSVKNDRETSYYTLEGDIVHETMLIFHGIINQIKDNPQFKKIYLDMSRVENIDSAAVGKLLSLKRFLENFAQERVLILRTSKEYLEFMHYLHLDKLFTIELVGN